MPEGQKIPDKFLTKRVINIIEKTFPSKYYFIAVPYCTFKPLSLKDNPEELEAWIKSILKNNILNVFPEIYDCLIYIIFCLFWCRIKFLCGKLSVP